MIDVNKIKAKIELQRNAILAKIGRLKKEDPFLTEDRSLIMEPATDAADLFSHEQIVVLENHLKRDLSEIESALKKMKKGTYGFCERCKKPIDPARLEVKPQAVYCLKCEAEVEGKK